MLERRRSSWPPAHRRFGTSFSPSQRFLLTVATSYPNVYGIDMPSRIELVAHQRTEAEISTAIGADLVIFQTLPDLVASCAQFNPTITDFDCSVFTGQYVTGGVDEDYLAQISIEMTDANNEINNVLSKLTALGSVSYPQSKRAGTDEKD